MSTPTKEEIQQLKSIQDDLKAKFREADQIMKSNGTQTPSYRRSYKAFLKLTKQIMALNNAINYLEDQSK